jgi:hypothetical protein
MHRKAPAFAPFFGAQAELALGPQRLGYTLGNQIVLTEMPLVAHPFRDRGPQDTPILRGLGW